MTRSWKMPLTRPSGRLACLRRTVPYGPYVCTCYAGWCAASRRGNRRLPDGRFGLPCAQRILLCDHIATILLPFLMTMQFFLATHLPMSQAGDGWCRSEEHTSELQSLRHLVCRLLLEKKKKNKYYGVLRRTVR